MFPITNTMFPLSLPSGLIHKATSTQGKNVSYLQAISVVTEGLLHLMNTIFKQLNSLLPIAMKNAVGGKS